MRSLSPSENNSLNLCKEDSLLTQTTVQKCKECEEQGATLYCANCTLYFCSDCSNIVHSLKMNKEHNIKEYKESPSDASQAFLSMVKSSFLKYYHCDKHNNEEMKLYCQPCNQFVCTYCIDEHGDHKTMTVMKYVELVNEKWKRNVEEVISDSLILPSVQLDEKRKEISLNNQTDFVEKEIARLEEEIKSLQYEKENLIDQLKELNKEN